MGCDEMNMVDNLFSKLKTGQNQREREFDFDFIYEDVLSIIIA